MPKFQTYNQIYALLWKLFLCFYSYKNSSARGQKPFSIWEMFSIFFSGILVFEMCLALRGQSWNKLQLTWLTKGNGFWSHLTTHTHSHGTIHLCVYQEVGLIADVGRNKGQHLWQVNFLLKLFFFAQRGFLFPVFCSVYLKSHFLFQKWNFWIELKLALYTSPLAEVTIFLYSASVALVHLLLCTYKNVDSAAVTTPNFA